MRLDETSTAVDYLQRTSSEPGPIEAGTRVTASTLATRRMVKVSRVGRLEKEPKPASNDDALRVVTADLLVGMASRLAPVAFRVDASGSKVDVSIGTWLPDGAAGEQLAQNARTLTSLLTSLYPFVLTEDGVNWEEDDLAVALARGIPTLSVAHPTDLALPLDRVIRALAGNSWSVLIVAQPIRARDLSNLRLALLNETREIAAPLALDGPNPLDEHYLELLKATLANIAQAQSYGAWRVAAYLAAPADTLPALTAAWCGVFSGKKSVPEPVRTFEFAGVDVLHHAWALPASTENATARKFSYPFSHQTIMSSTQLSAYIHFPDIETSGFGIDLVPNFDTARRRPSNGRAVELGTIVERGRPGNEVMQIDMESLKRHAFVTGLTGEGKTTTLKRVLAQATANGVPFLVIEPVKREYRALREDPRFGPSVAVYTLGDEGETPLRFNPFECPPHGVATHIDLLRSAFSAGFGMWTPLPQVLEMCLREIYTDRGWNLTSGENYRLGGHDCHELAFPTMADLLGKVDAVVARLGYEERISKDFRAALSTRLSGLCDGGRGRLLNTRHSVPFTELLRRPVVLELESLGDDDDKALVMALLLARIVEQRRLEPHPQLCHLLVIEEAHRILSAVNPNTDEYQANPRAKAVDTFANLLAEIRAYGQGVIVVDQIATKLAPEVIKNTSIKIAHRVVAADDRSVLAASMAMTEDQSKALASLEVGHAAVFLDGEDAPLLVKVRPAAEDPTTSTADAAPHPASDPLPIVPPPGRCLYQCHSDPRVCDAARAASRDRDVCDTMGRLALTAAVAPAGVDAVWQDLEMLLAPMTPAEVDRSGFITAAEVHAAHAHADRRGAQEGWPFTVTASFAAALERDVRRRMSDGRTSSLESIDATPSCRPGPFPWCPELHPTAIRCRCRFAVADVIDAQWVHEGWLRAPDAPARVRLAKDVAYRALQFPQDAEDDAWLDAVRNVTLCAAQQLLVGDESIHPRSRVAAMKAVLEEVRSQ